MIGFRNRTAAAAGVASRRKLRQFISAGDEATSGVAAIEFAVTASCLVLLMICVVDLGMGFYRKMQVQSAAQNGANYVMLHGFDATSIASAVTTATSFADLSASPAPVQYCGCPSNTGIASGICSSVCADGSTPITYVLVSAQGTYNTVLSYPLIPSSIVLTAQARVRVP